jgi:hypothetical protein
VLFSLSSTYPVGGFIYFFFFLIIQEKFRWEGEPIHNKRMRPTIIPEFQEK